MKMDEQEKQQYMTAMVAKGAEVTAGAEAICLAEFQKVVKNLEQADASLTQARNEATRLDGVVKTLRGKRMALFDLLIATEERRRSVGNSSGLEVVPEGKKDKPKRKKRSRS